MSLFCKKCGSKLSEDSAFCSSCGEKVEENTQNSNTNYNTNTNQNNNGSSFANQSYNNNNVMECVNFAEDEVKVREYLCSNMDFPKARGILTVTNKRVLFRGKALNYDISQEGTPVVCPANCCVSLSVSLSSKSEFFLASCAGSLTSTPT